jgi:hypothetical protein
MLVNNTIISRIIIGLFLIMVTCWLPVSGADNVSVTPVTTPFITIDPIGNHTVGDVFFINGTTNFPVSENLSMHIQSTIIRKGRYWGDPVEILAFISSISIYPDQSENNRWSMNVTNSINQLRSDEYDVVVEKNSGLGSECNVSATDVFFLFPRFGNITLTNFQTTIQKSSRTPAITTVTTEPTTHSSGFSFFQPSTVIALFICTRELIKRRGRE